MTASPIRLHPHAWMRTTERGATIAEVTETVASGEKFVAKHGRSGFRKNFSGPFGWRGKAYETKQLEAYAVFEEGSWLVITVVVKYF